MRQEIELIIGEGDAYRLVKALEAYYSPSNGMGRGRYVRHRIIFEPIDDKPACETCIHNVPDGETLEDLGYKMQYCGHCLDYPGRISEWEPKPAPGPEDD